MASAKDPIVAISNTLYSSDDVQSQAPAPSSEAATGGTLGDGEGLEDAEGADMVNLTSLEGEVPQVSMPTGLRTRTLPKACRSFGVVAWYSDSASPNFHLRHRGRL